MHTLVQASVTHPCQSRPLVERAIVATVAISNPAQGRFLFFLLVWRRDIPNVCTSHLLPTSCWATSSTRNRERAREHETIFFYKLHPPSIANTRRWWNPWVIATHHTHRTARRPKRTPTIGSAQFPNTDHTSRVVPRPREFERVNNETSESGKVPLFLHNHVEGRFFFYFQICTCLYNRNVYCEFWVRSIFVLGTRFGRRYSTYGWRLIRSCRIEVGSLA